MNLSLSEKYVIHNVSKKGIIRNFHKNHIISAFFMDLIVNKFITISNNCMSVNEELTYDYDFLIPIYDIIKKNPGIEYKNFKNRLTFQKVFRNLFTKSFEELRKKMVLNKLLIKENDKYLANEDIKKEISNEIKQLINAQNLKEEQMYLFILFKNNFDFTESLIGDDRKIFFSQSEYYLSLYKTLMYSPHALINKVFTPVLIIGFLCIGFNIVAVGSIIYYLILFIIFADFLLIGINIFLAFKNILKKSS